MFFVPDRKFQNGDKVKVVDHHSYMYGEEGVVVGYDSNTPHSPYRVKFVGIWYEHGFEEHDLSKIYSKYKNNDNYVYEQNIMQHIHACTNCKHYSLLHENCSKGYCNSKTCNNFIYINLNK